MRQIAFSASAFRFFAGFCFPSRLDRTGCCPSSWYTQLREQPLCDKQVSDNENENPDPTRHQFAPNVEVDLARR